MDKKRQKRRPNYAVPALDRGLDILEALSASATPLSLTDIARAVKSTPSAVFRLMARFEQRAYVVKDAVSGKYGLTLRLFELSHTHSPVETLLGAAAIPMRDLAESVGESVHLSMINHGKLVVLMDVGASQHWRISFDVGARFPVVHTNSGRLLMAHLSAHERDDLLSTDPDYAALTQPERKRLSRELDKIRRIGYAISCSEERGGLEDLAVLCGNPAIGHMAALAIACMRSGKDNVHILRLVNALADCAARITAAQGLKL